MWHKIRILDSLTGQPLYKSKLRADSTYYDISVIRIDVKEYSGKNFMSQKMFYSPKKSWHLQDSVFYWGFPKSSKGYKGLADCVLVKGVIDSIDNQLPTLTIISSLNGGSGYSGSPIFIITREGPKLLGVHHKSLYWSGVPKTSYGISMKKAIEIIDENWPHL
jgi:hypothetical protein